MKPFTTCVYIPVGRFPKQAAACALVLTVLWAEREAVAFDTTQVTGGTPDTVADNQSETNCNLSVTGSTRVESVAFNDGTAESPNFISYAVPSGRAVFPGASDVGWSFRVRDDSGDGPWTHAHVQPPMSLGWDVLWGDPSMASNPEMPQFVFLGTLAIPHDKFLFASNADGTPGVLQGAFTDNPSPLGGGCVARSMDGGQSFAVVDCVRNETPVTANNEDGETLGHFYDGSSMAVTEGATVGTFSAFISFIDTDLGREASWMMDDVTSNAAHPFHLDTTAMGSLGTMPTDEGLGPIETHVRLRASGADLWKMSVDTTGANPFFEDPGGRFEAFPAILKVNLRDRNGNAVQLADDAVLAPAVDFGADSSGNEVTLRTGPQFAFDIGVNEANATEMRFVYVAADFGGFFLQGGFCSPDLTCVRPPQWRTPVTATPTALFPAIKFGAAPSSGVPNWVVTFQSVSVPQLAIFSAALVRPDLAPAGMPASSSLVLTEQTQFQTPCPDIRGGSLLNNSGLGAGYWGDYDDMTYDPVTGNFIRSYTDSSLGCVTRTTFNSSNVHVSAVEIPAVGAPRAAQVTLSSISFATSGFNLTNCQTGSETQRGISGEDANGDLVFTCAPNLNADGSLSTTPVHPISEQVSCGDDHGAWVDITCQGTTGMPGDLSISGNVELTISSHCGTDDMPNDNGDTFPFTQLVPGQPQSNPSLPLQSCDVFNHFCATGEQCTFNSFQANASVSNVPL